MISFEDAREGMAKLPSNSIDLIITDPPYLKDCIYLYGDLAREGERVLKEGSYLFAYCGAQFIPEILDLMKPYLDWFWLFEIKHMGGYPRFWSKKIMVGCKPVIVMTKGKPKRLEWLANLHYDKGRDKRFHAWGQNTSFPRKVISVLTNNGDTILDPFVGGGTTAKVCKELDRKFIGFEVDSSLKKIIDNRLSQECLQNYITVSPKDCS